MKNKIQTKQKTKQKTKIKKDYESQDMKKEWDDQWDKLDNSIFGKICSLHRYFLISRSVKYFTDKYFKNTGVYVDCGSGTSESSFRMKKHNRLLIPLDISFDILKYSSRFKQFSRPVNADIMFLPFKNSSINGIWNLGVMEHFDKNELKTILDEFHRILKNGGHILLFWPAVYGSSELFLGLIEKTINLFKKDEFKFMTEEKTPIRAKSEIKNILENSGFKFVKMHFNAIDAFTYCIVVGQKK